jgi:autotransporter-associated beta strand protein
MEQILKSGLHPKVLTGERLFGQGSFTIVVASLLFACASVQVHAQELITNGNFSNGLSDWTTSNFGGAPGQFGINENGPTSTAAASGNYAYAGGSTYNLLQQNVTVTTGSAYRLTFLAGSKSGQGNANGVLSLRQEALSNYNSASFDYQPSDAVFGSYTVDFVADTTTIGVWLRSNNSYAAYDSVSVTEIASVENAMNYSSASGYSQISSALTGSGKVTVNAGTGGFTLAGANTHTGGTEVTGGTLFVAGAGTLGATDGTVTVSGGGILDLRNQQIRTGTISMNNQDARIISGDVNNPGSIVNNGGAFLFGGGLLNVPLSGSGGMDVTGGGSINSSNSYTGVTTISGTTGWYGANQLFVNNANALGAASGDLTISGGYVNLLSNTITRSGNVTVSGGIIENGTLSKSESNYNIQGGSVGASLAGTAGLTKSGAGNSAIYGANTYSGDTVIDQGTLVVGSAEGLGNAAGAVTVNSGGALYLGGGLTVERTGDVTVNGGSLTTDVNNFGTISVSGGNFIANNAAVLAVKLAGTAGLTVGGTGETYLWTDSSYTGATVISSGTLTLGGNGAISSQSSLQIDSGAAVNLTGPLLPNYVNRTFAGLTGAGVLSGGGGTVTINKASGTDTFSGVISGAQGVIKDGAGTLELSGASTYTGTTSVNAGTLVIKKYNLTDLILTATISPTTLAVDFLSTPAAGTYNILSGPLASASLGSTTVTVAGGSLPPGLEATVYDNPLRVIVTSAGPTFESVYPDIIDPSEIDPANGLAYLMNYALGGTGPGSNPALPVLTSDANSLTLTANIRNSGQGVSVVGEYTYDLAGDWTEMGLTATGATPSVENTTVKSFSISVEPGQARKFMRFKVIKQ